MRIGTLLIASLAFVISSCSPFPGDLGSGGNDGGVPLPEPSYCESPPYAQLNGSGFGTWASPTCTGDIARGQFAVGNNDSLVHRCAQWLPSDEVWCVDPSSPVPKIYFKDPNQAGSCVEWTETTEPWFIWRSCGIKPIVAPPVADASADSGAMCTCELPHSAPLLYGPNVTLTSDEHTVRVKGNGDALTTVHLPLASTVPGQRWTVKVWGSDANQLTFLPATDPETGLMDSMNDVDGDSLLETSGLNPAIVIEAYVDQGDDGPLPGWMVISR